MIKYIILFLILCLIIDILRSNRSNYYNYIDSKKILERKREKKIEYHIEETQGIPKKIIQTYKKKDLIPTNIIKNITDKNLDWEYNFYDDEECVNFLYEEFGKEYVDKFYSFKKGAHKSDLFRICWLYVNGGVYIDIDTEIIIKLDDIIDNIENDFTILQNRIRNRGRFEKYISSLFGYHHETLINSLIIVNKGNKYIKKCIENIMKINQEDLENNYGLILFVMQQTLKNNIKYQIFEEPTSPILFIYNRDGIYDKNNKLIGYSKYKNYKNGFFY